MTKKILFIIGTRPEAIKIAPVYQALRSHDQFKPLLCLTGQHQAMAEDILDFFNITHDFRLDLTRATFSLAEFTSQCLQAVSAVMEKSAPDLVFVHGDTASTFCGALAAFYHKVPLAHLEAGLRTYDKHAPFPEEMLRKMTGALADLHFAPTESARQALQKEGVPAQSIHVVGNSVVDALLWTRRLLETNAALRQQIQGDLQSLGLPTDLTDKTILITGHRRENFGKRFENICQAIRELAKAYPDSYFVYPVHLNPNVQKPVQKILGGIPNVHLLPPVNYPHFVYLMQACRFILTDSGGIQEEAPALGKPVLVMRDTTERPEALAAGCAKLVGVEAIVSAATALLEDTALYAAMSQASNPYGDGHTAEKIVRILEAAI